MTSNGDITVNVQAAISADFIASPEEANAPVTVQFTSNPGGTGYFWNFGDGGTSTDPNPTHTYVEVGEFEVMLVVLTSNGCADTSYKEIFVQPHIPNVFTPNGDGKNDRFIIPLQGMASYTLVIYNRWGAKLFESTDPSKGWDGTTEGKPVPDGTYYFIVRGESRKGKLYEEAGHLTLTR